MSTTTTKVAPKVIFANLDTGEVLSETQFYTVDKVSGNRVQLTNDDGDQVYLEQRDPSFMAEYYSTPSSSSTSIPKYYANWDENYWGVAPTPDTAYAMTLAFNKEPASLPSTFRR